MNCLTAPIAKMTFTNIFGFLLILGTVNTAIAQFSSPPTTVPLAEQCRPTIGLVAGSNFVRNQTAVSEFYNSLWKPGAEGLANCSHIEIFQKDLKDWTDFTLRCVAPEERETADILRHFLDVATRFICKDKKDQFTAIVNSPDSLRCWRAQTEVVLKECVSDVNFGVDKTFELLKSNGPKIPTVDVFPKFVPFPKVSTAFDDYQQCFVRLLNECNKPLGEFIDSLLNEVKGVQAPPATEPSPSSSSSSFNVVNIVLLAVAAPALWGLA